MTGRTPELFGRKIEAAEIKLLAIIILIQPLVILAFTALSLSVPAYLELVIQDHMVLAKCSTNMFLHLQTMVRSFEGLGDNTVWWNMFLHLQTMVQVSKVLEQHCMVECYL